MDEASEDFTAEDTAADDGAFILYTSGTTKHPKGALHTHGYTHAKWMQARYWLDLQEGDRLWCTSGTGWAKSIWNIFLGPWSQGTEIFFHEGGFDPAERLDLIERYDISVLCQAPTEYRLLAKTPELEERGPLHHPARRLRRRTPEPAGHRALERAARPHHLRRLRPDGEHPARRQLPRPRSEARRHGQTVSRLRREDHRPRRQRVPARRAGRHRPLRKNPRALQGVLGTARRDRGRVPRRLLPDRRQGVQGRRRIPLVRGPFGRRHHSPPVTASGPSR